MSLRQDIQFLRGLAVSIVVLEHAGIGPVAGFLGVDVFFVISGYLITRLIQTRIEAGTFSFSEFYARRAKRLLPAAFATFALTALAAPFFLTTNEMAAFREQLIGSLTFTANYVLYGQSGYFDGEAKLKPLLHIWSLSLEEQYYFILPLVLFLTPKRFWSPLTVVALIGSFALCMHFLLRDPSLAFYSLPTRAWELCVGSLVALMRLDVNPHRFFKWAFWPAAAGLLAVPFVPTGLPHPGLDAVLVCLGTAVVIVNGRQFFGRVYPLRATAWVGDASYSIYLAHWPIMAFLNNAHLNEVSFEMRLLSIALTLMFGLALYYLIERPIHKSSGNLSLRRVSALGGVAASLMVAPLILSDLANAKNQYDFEEIRRANYGFARACDQRGDQFLVLDECQFGDPTVALWGDSFAMHLVQGLAANNDFGFIQATRTSCPPVLGYAQYENSGRYTDVWAKSCIDFNESAFRYITQNDDIEIVVLSATFRAFTFAEPWQALVRNASHPDVVSSPITDELALETLVGTIEALRSAGKRVVIFGPVPSGGRNFIECIEREVTGKITLDADGCTFTRSSADRRLRGVTKLLDTLSTQANVAVVDPRQWMCDEKTCQTSRNNVPLYRDSIHLSELGSAMLGAEFEWTSLVQKFAQ